MRISGRFCFSSAAASLFVIGALLHSPSESMAQQQALVKTCAGDIKTQCAGVQPGEGRIRACIKAHFNDLSAPCQALLTHAAAVGKACAADVKQNCADIKPGGGRIEACMKAHITDLSEPCKDALGKSITGAS